MALSVIQTSFAAGELSPNLYGRVDLDKYHVGAALMRNFFVDFRGGASTRPGTKYVAMTKYATTTVSPRVIPFIFSQEFAYLIELGNAYVRIYRFGNFVQELVAPWAAEDVFMLKYDQSADVMTLTHPDYPIQQLKRLTATTFSLGPLSIGPDLPRPGNMICTATVGSAVLKYGYTVTAVDIDGDESQQADYNTTNSVILDPAAATPAVVNVRWTGVPGAQYYNVYKWGPITYSSSHIPSFFGYIGQSEIPLFCDNNIAPDYAVNPPSFRDPFSPGQITSVSVASGGTGYTGDVYVANFSGGGGSGAAGYAVPDPETDDIVGLVLVRNGVNYTTSPTITLTGTGGSGAAFTVTIDPNAYYPTCCAYFSQRHCFAGPTLFPERVEMSRPGLYSNFDLSVTGRADDAISFDVATTQVNQIKHLVPMPTGLVALTLGGAFLISGGGPYTQVSPTTITALPQASPGCSDLRPIVANSNILFVQAKGSIVRDLAFNFYVQTYFGTDRSILAGQLFFGHTIVDWAWAEEPFKLIWAVRDDGRLLSMTYVPDQEVYGWARHDTQGLFLSVCVLPEKGEDVPYFVVRRYVNGVWTNFIERMSSRKFISPEDANCLDLSYEFQRTEPNMVLNVGPPNIDGTVDLWTDTDLFTLPGFVIWAGGGAINVTAVTDHRHATGKIFRDMMTTEIPDVSPPFFPPFPAGSWTYDMPISSLSGLGFAEGQVFGMMIDGLYQGTGVVTGGVLALPVPGTRVKVGLLYQCQLQSLYLDIGQPTIQGRRKSLPAVTVRVDLARGLKAGPNFDDLTEYKDMPSPYSSPASLFTGDQRVVIGGNYNVEGQLCVQQDYPLPATVLGLIPEVVVGDTQR